MPNEDTTHFTAVDQTADPSFFARFLDEGNKLPAIVASKPMIIEGMRLRGGERVLDVAAAAWVRTCSTWRPESERRGT